MFPGGYFPPGYFPPGYWPKTGAARVGGAVAAGYAQRVLRAMVAAEEYSRSLLDAENMRMVQEAVLKRAAAGAWLRKLEQDYQQKCLEWAAYSVVLSEI